MNRLTVLPSDWLALPWLALMLALGSLLTATVPAN